MEIQKNIAIWFVAQTSRRAFPFGIQQVAKRVQKTLKSAQPGKPWKAVTTMEPLN